jgi:MoaA/NifB/PqqE/SkfB family radical SAM enzyme
MNVQIEIGTHCNFKCFYCVGRDMPQRYMPMETFSAILDRLPPGRHRVSLQGEGEPTTHPHFWEMVALLKARGAIPYTITNASVIDPRRAAREFPKIGVSLDTVDPSEGRRIGRYKLERVMENVEALVQAYGDPAKVIVHTVDYGQDIAPVRQWLTGLGITKHYPQPLQSKDDYAYRYPDKVPRNRPECRYRCRYVEAPIMLYYDIQGVEMPCCFIKDSAKFVSTEEIRASLARREVPDCCSGCRELYSD